MKIFENKVLRGCNGKMKINEKLHKLFSSPITFRHIKSGLRWIGQVARREKIN
jgi:hypothetical protein